MKKILFVLIIMIFYTDINIYAQQRNVTITVYNKGRQTADGTVIPWQKVRNGSFKGCAISPNLFIKKGGPYNFGDTIHIEGTGYLDGDYIIHDLTSNKHSNWVDLLVPPSINHGRWKGKITNHRPKKEKNKKK